MKSKLLGLSALSLASAVAARADDTVTTITTSVTSVSALVTTLIGLGVTVLTWRLVRKYVSKA